MGLTQEQRVEMHTEKRRLHGVGDPSGAAAIATALLEDRYFVGVAAVEKEEFEAPKTNAKKSDWVEFALNVSDIEPEIINSATRKDIIGMLRANSLID